MTASPSNGNAPLPESSLSTSANTSNDAVAVSPNKDNLHSLPLICFGRT